MNNILYCDAGYCGRHNGTSNFLCLVTDEFGNVVDFCFSNSGDILLAEIKAIYMACCKSNLICDKPHVFTDCKDAVELIHSKRIIDKYNFNLKKSSLLKEIRKMKKKNNIQIQWMGREKNVAGIVLERKQKIAHIKKRKRRKSRIVSEPQPSNKTRKVKQFDYKRNIVRW